MKKTKQEHKCFGSFDDNESMCKRCEHKISCDVVKRIYNKDVEDVY